MQPTKELVPYDEFGRLRLLQFCPNNDTYRESIVDKSQGHFIEERIYHGITFWRWSEYPDELAIICISSADYIWPQNIAATILSAIGLRLEGGLSYEETASRFSTPPCWRSKDGLLSIFHVGKDSPYEVNCGFLNDKKLDRLMIHRLDFKTPFNEECQSV